MNLETGCDLGHGVRVMPGVGRGLVVQSGAIDLGWRARQGGEAGSAVVWHGESFEVLANEPFREGHRWFLEPWSGEQVMRVVLSLDEDWVDDASRAAKRIAQAAKLRAWMWPFLPLLGMAPESWQRRWRNDWNYPAALATSVSAVLEAVLGAACLVEFMAKVGAGATIFPWIPRPLVIMGGVLLPEGLVRLAQVFADSEPVGSVFGLVASVFYRPKGAAEAPIPVPTVSAYDGAEGTLELDSPIQRRDWEGPGVLSYRDEVYTLAETRRLGENWIYSFARGDGGELEAEPRFRLAPPRILSKPTPRESPPGFIRIALLTTVVCLAPGRFQERWARVLEVHPLWLTVLGAGAELVGGLNNLGSNGDAGTGTILLAIFFIAEAVVRFGSLATTGRPMGSLLGWPFAPLLERVIPESGDR